jgi:Tol biopolymer transport system component
LITGNVMTISTVVPRVDHTWPLHVSISADGRYVVFANFFALEQANIVAESSLDVFRVDTQTGQLQLVSGPHGTGLSRADMPVVAGDGMRVAYRSWVDGADNTTQTGIAVKDMATGTTIQVAGATGSTPVFYDDLSMSSDAHLVAYMTRPAYGDYSKESIVVQDVRTKQVVFRQDNLGNVHQVQLSGDGKSLLIDDDGLRIVNVANGTSQVIANAHDDNGGMAVSISADGRYVLYAANAGEVVPGASATDVALVRKDLQTGAVKVVQQASGSAWDLYSPQELMSPDGRFVAFSGDPVSHQFAPASNTPLLMDLETGSVIRGYANPQTLGNGAIVYEVSSEVHPEYITEGTLKMATIAAGVVQTGGDGNDVLTGTDSADKLSGQGGNDRLTGGAGDDVIDGGTGVDTAVYAGRHDAYAIASAGAGAWTVQDKAGNEGTDHLTGVERLHFADVDVALDVDGTAGQAYRIYQAAFARPPELTGVGYWMGMMDKGVSLKAVAQGFVESAEFANLYGAAPGNREIVEKFYQNVLHRPGEAAGIDWWTGQLDHKLSTVAEALIGFSEGAENQAALVGVLANGIEYTPLG